MTLPLVDPLAWAGLAWAGLGWLLWGWLGCWLGLLKLWDGFDCWLGLLKVWAWFDCWLGLKLCGWLGLVKVLGLGWLFWVFCVTTLPCLRGWGRGALAGGAGRSWGRWGRGARPPPNSWARKPPWATAGGTSTQRAASINTCTCVRKLV